MKRFSVLIADDHPLYREGLAGLLAATDDLVVVAQAADGAEAVSLAGDLLPDVAVLDVAMPRLDGIEAARRISAASPRTRILMLTMLADASVVAAVRAGAHGYALKSSTPEATMAAIRSVALGNVVFSAELGARLAEGLATPGATLPGLTPRERDVLTLIARGWDNPRISARLGIADKTVRNTVSAILLKLQVTDRVAAGEKARAAGLG
ncbi:response regulator transcription factor [Propioniciclava coleopterorum]|uniref:Response regulator transcription factor n=1 Tax=Propioniciclava coleopterorum TaxID=2714937 RepID=A0A6G7Y2J2_9ACTN|nr:response regulator transcription factor [Propioniciclava coleopterorum]QIK70993.1 response regulator transcription factor [Propioniciclava coleopterorum]